MIYLAGPTNGCNDTEAMTWRDKAKDYLGASNCLDPMRRDYRGLEDEMVEEIVELDKADIKTSTLMIANCWQVSVGTSMEIMYAFDRHIPVFAIVPPGSLISPWLRYHTAVCESLNQALELARNTI